MTTQEQEEARATRQAIIEDAAVVQRFMESETIRGMLRAMRKELRSRWELADTLEAREELHRMVKTLGRFEEWLITVAERGDIALAEIRFEDEQEAFEKAEEQRTERVVRHEM